MSKIIKNDNKIKILKHGEDLFYKNGYTNTYIEDIVDASGVSNGTFYHYYENKAALCYAFLVEVQKRFNKSMSFFPDENIVVQNMLSIIVHWYFYFNSPQLRRIQFEITNNIIIDRDKDFLSNACLNFTKKIFKPKDINLKFAAISGIRDHTNILLYKQTELYTYDEIAIFMIIQTCNLFEIPKKNTNVMIKRAFELFEQLDISINQFDIVISRKSNP